MRSIPSPSSPSPTLTDFADNYLVIPRRWRRRRRQTGFLYQTGYTPFSLTFTTAGTYSLGIGVANVTTDQYSSGLLVDQLRAVLGEHHQRIVRTGDFTGWSTIGNTSIQTIGFGIGPTGGPYQALISTASVPEPSSILLLLTGGLGAAFVIRRMARATPTRRAA